MKVRLQWVCWVAAAIGVPAVAQVATPPGQPAFGPGGRDYLHASLRVTGPFFAKNKTEDAFRYFLFEPSNPAPASAPVVLFLHGFAALDPTAYQYWYAHMVLKGYTVIWAQYQNQYNSLDSWNWANNAADVMIDALARLDQADRVRPARNTQNKYRTAIVGHSLGGFFGFVLAAKATRSWWTALPQPEVVVAIEPGAKRLVPGEDYSRIPAATKVLMVSGEEDNINCVDQAVQIWGRMLQIPETNKNFVLVRSDVSGSPRQIANHFFPNTSGAEDTAAVDARDYFVTWKLSVAALNCAFKGTDCTTAFGNGSAPQTDMGAWSDGRPVTPMAFYASPAFAPVKCTTAP